MRTLNIVRTVRTNEKTMRTWSKTIQIQNFFLHLSLLFEYNVRNLIYTFKFT